ncbi:unnamed protein product [Dracunculus medinensis]|uniref:UBIQUITIN_CONJUGAT_2 domain-containing protein n=1 Tax=Dracunculus medinensis TaxID=318479 RepID=A0A0N4UJ99_DRAME|nr:unnamed protein product [Dracunculus medinensis]
MISAWGRHAYDIFILGSTKLVRRIFRLAACKMGITFSSPSSPEPDDSLSTADRLNTFLDQKPLKMANMLKLARIINDCTPEEKLCLYRAGVVHRICKMIAEFGSIDNGKKIVSEMEEKGRKMLRKSSNTLRTKGVGYGHGSTRSRWDIERTVEEKLAREEHLIWLLNAVTAYIYCISPDFSNEEQLRFIRQNPVHIGPSVIKEIGESAIVPLLEYHLNNGSIFDISEHMELYQALLETAAAMSVIPSLVPYLVRPQHPGSRSIAKDLILRFSSAMASYPNIFKNQMGSPDFRLIDFISKIEHYSEVLINAARTYEHDLPAEQRVHTAGLQPQLITHNAATTFTGHNAENLKLSFIGEYGKLVEQFTFKKEVRCVNPFSPASKDRTKRIAKELASMANTLPLNASNSIFICVDESRCDIVKALISGPDDTPYQNGLFEFDVFFPPRQVVYPYSPPRCMFLTTGSGAVRFNPNLYNDGKICLSILGTWEGRPEEKWNPYCSLLQILISIQGLIFVRDPYFNEPGFEKYQGTTKGDECSQKYNLQVEHATLVYAIRNQLRNGPEYFRNVIQRHFWLKRHHIIEQANRWLIRIREDAANPDNLKRKSSPHVELICEPIIQVYLSFFYAIKKNIERRILQLIDELNNMSYPVDLGEFINGYNNKIF